MRSKKGLFFLSLITIFNLRQCEGSKITENVIATASNLLFGDIWSFGHYCGHNLTGPEKAQDDLLHQGFFNGSRLDSISNLNRPSEIKRGLNELIQNGLRARSSISIICSVSSWGYAEKTSSKRANARSRDDPTACWSALNRMVSSMKILSSQRDGECRDNGTNQNLQITSQAIGNDRLLSDWLQVNTFGRINQGLPFESHIWLGDYNACKRLPQTRYCYGALRSGSWSRFGKHEGDNFIRVGMCLPRECNSRSFSSWDQLMSVLDQLLNEQHLGNRDSLLGGESLRLVDVFCLPEDDSPLRRIFGDFMSLILILGAVAWVSVIIRATFFRRLENQSPQDTGPKYRILNSFNLKTGWHKFFQSRPDTEGLVGFDFIKVLGILWLISSHNLHIILPYLRNPRDLHITGHSSPLIMIILQSQHGVVQFFLISGFLAGYKHLQRRNTRSIQFTRIIVERYARLAPMYVLIYAFVKKFAHLMSSGPLWDYGVSPQSEIRQCMKESWLVPILMLANFVPPFSHCILTGWHIANDFHIFLLIPLLLKVYQWSRLSGRIVTVVSFSASHLYHFWKFHHADNFNFATLTREPFTIGIRTLMERFAELYVSPIGRFGTYFLGFLLADLIIELRSNNKKAADRTEAADDMIELDRIDSSYKKEPDQQTGIQPKPNTRDKILLNTAIMHLILGLIFPTMPTSLIDSFGPYSKSVSYPLVRVMNELCWFYILYYILKEQSDSLGATEVCRKKVEFSTENASGSSKLIRFLAMPIWSVAIKLNYTLVIIHFTIARYLIQSQTQLLNFSWFNLAQMITFNVFVTYCVAFIVHLTVEIPLMSIAKEGLTVAKFKSGHNGTSEQIKANKKFIEGRS